MRMREKNRRLLAEVRVLRAWKRVAFNFGITIEPYCATGGRAVIRVTLPGGRTLAGYGWSNDFDAAARELAEQLGK